MRRIFDFLSAIFSPSISIPVFDIGHRFVFWDCVVHVGKCSARKSVENSTHPRNYYKCNVLDCPAKKYMEKIVEEDGSIKYNTIYKGQHCHDPPSVTEIPIIESQESFKRIVQTKMQIKKEEKIRTRLMVELNNNVNAREDGYRWRKYGEKPLKSSSVSRSYYKCSDCTVKKQVELSVEKTLVIYEGVHTHSPADIPKDVTEKRNKKIKVECGNENSLSEFQPIQTCFEPVAPSNTSLLELCNVATFAKSSMFHPPDILEPNFMPCSNIYPYYQVPPLVDNEIEEDYITDKTVQTLLFLKSFPNVKNK